MGCHVSQYQENDDSFYAFILTNESLPTGLYPSFPGQNVDTDIYVNNTDEVKFVMFELWMYTSSGKPWYQDDPSYGQSLNLKIYGNPNVDAVGASNPYNYACGYGEQITSINNPVSLAWKRYIESQYFINDESMKDLFGHRRFPFRWRAKIAGNSNYVYYHSVIVPLLPSDHLSFVCPNNSWYGATFLYGLCNLRKIRYKKDTRRIITSHASEQLNLNSKCTALRQMNRVPMTQIKTNGINLMIGVNDTSHDNYYYSRAMNYYKGAVCPIPDSHIDDLDVLSSVYTSTDGAPTYYPCLFVDGSFTDPIVMGNSDMLYELTEFEYV